MKIIITAANGFIGTSLVNHFKKENEVICFVRKIDTKLKSQFGEKVKMIIWDGKTKGNWIDELENSDVLINLAGKSVDCRYNEENKNEIYASRLESTKILGGAIKSLKNKPKVWFNAASATIYKHSLTVPNTEKNGTIGEGFSVDVCRKWEESFFNFKDLGVRQIALRTAIVLGKNGGVMKPFNRLVNFGLGGKMGKGNQQFSWIHEKDVCSAISFLINNEKSSGVYNISAPNPITNAFFMKTLRNTNKAFFGIPSPTWLLKIGAWIINTETELILKSRFVIPEKLRQEGFEFEFKTIDLCLNDLKKK